jgi:hypothetical protein
VCGDTPRLAFLRFRRLNEADDFGGNAAVKRDVLLEQRQHSVGERSRLGRRARVGPLDWKRIRANVRTGRRISRDLGAREPLDQNASASIWETHNLKDSSEHADAMQICSARLLRFAFFLRDEENQLIAFDCRIDCSKRCGPANKQGDNYIGKNNNVTKRENGYTLSCLDSLTVANEFHMGESNGNQPSAVSS